MLSFIMGSGGQLLAKLDLLGWLSDSGFFLIAILGFSFVVFVHELGHFLAAKWVGIDVEKFCIGFGRELFGFDYKGTRYGWNLLPLGGYVKMLGQEDFVVDKSGELRVKDNPGSFTNKTVGQRMIVVSAGVIMNLIFAMIGLTVYMMVGYDTAPPVVGTVQAASPAARAGLIPGDRITAINGNEITEYGDLPMRIALSDPDEVLELDVFRDGRQLLPKPRMVPRFNENERIRQLGIGNGYNRTVLVTDSLLEKPAANELHRFDRIDGIVKHGETETVTPIRGIGDVHQALVAARGQPVELEALRPDTPASGRALVEPEIEDMPGTKVRAFSRARWYVDSETPGNVDTASLLGLVPRFLAWRVTPDGPADKAGVSPLDTIVSYLGRGNLSRDEFANMVKGGGVTTGTLTVRRPRGANKGLSAEGVAFVARHREAWLAAAAKDVADAAALVSQSLDAEMPLQAPTTHPAATRPNDESDRMTVADAAVIRAAAAKAATPRDWLVWLEGIDQLQLPVTPVKPFSLWGSSVPRVGIILDPPVPEDDVLAVANVIEKIDDRPSPAFAAGIPRGAVIVAVDGTPVATWSDLSERFRAAVGREVTLRYRVGMAYHDAALAVPPDIAIAMGLPEGAQIQAINGASSATIPGSGGKPRPHFLPDWLAVRALLKANVGRTVEVEYLTPNGENARGSYAVSEAGTDPWSLRVRYEMKFLCYPLVERVRETNLLAAMRKGIVKTYLYTWSTVQSIRHIIFTRQVGADKISGPIGIAKMGKQAAEAGWVPLLFLMCVISANLAVINSLPLPIMDGGLFFFLILEKIRGEPVSIKVQAATQLIGIVLIAAIFLFASWQDVTR